MLIVMAENDHEIQRYEYFLKPGYIFLSREPVIIYTVLGSCVAVCLWDTKNRFGGINHFLYPMITEPKKATAQYGNIAILTLIRRILAEGSEISSLEAQIIGGGDLNSNEDSGMGNQNIRIARKILKHQGIPITSEDVGGRKGRKLIYNPGTNEAAVLKVDRIRQEDWYPYQG